MPNSKCVGEIVWQSPSGRWVVIPDPEGAYSSSGPDGKCLDRWATRDDAVARCVRDMDETAERRVQFGAAVEALTDRYRRGLVRGRPETVLHLYRREVDVEANVLLDGERCLATETCGTARRKPEGGVA